MNLHSRSVAAPSSFCQTPRITLGKRARFNESLKGQIAGRCNSSSRRTSRGEVFLTRFGANGIQNIASSQASNIPRAFRVAARSGSFHIESHWSGSFFAGRRPTTFQQPSIKIAVKHPASTL
jgi:hypothetical protein